MSINQEKTKEEFFNCLRLNNFIKDNNINNNIDNVKKNKEEYEEKEYFNLNRINIDYYNLKNDYDKEIIKSQNLEKIVDNLKNETLKIKEILINDCKGNLLLIEYLKHVIEDSESILKFNLEKDKNLHDLFNIFSKKIIEFNDLSYQKGIALLIYDENLKNYKHLSKKEAFTILNNIDNSKDSNQKDPNETSFVYIPKDNTFINIDCENPNIISEWKDAKLVLDPYNNQ